MNLKAEALNAVVEGQLIGTIARKKCLRLTLFEVQLQGQLSVGSGRDGESHEEDSHSKAKQLGNGIEDTPPGVKITFDGKLARRWVRTPYGDLRGD
jgi:hypothetical protein